MQGRRWWRSTNQNFKKCSGMNAVRNVAQEYVNKLPIVVAEPEVATEEVGMSIAEVIVPRVLIEGEAMEQGQRYPTIAKEGIDLMGSGADDEVDREVVADDILWLRMARRPMRSMTWLLFA